MEHYSVFKVLSDKNRYDILNVIKKNKEICACELLKEFDITQATLAYHMKLLKEVGLVDCYKKGTWCIYKLNNNKLYELSDYFTNLIEEDN